ncbi:MAG: hypothetical protein VKJ46_01430 [Leptolyngbyaceae bacterium]|nr:hypothetical protein [Leptolyngbyaceae bacterium]
MTPTKLSESDKQEILKLYHLPGESTSTLSARYHVSPTTITRILKSGLSEQEYEAIVQQKRTPRSQSLVLESSSEPPSAMAEQTELPLEIATPVSPVEKPSQEPREEPSPSLPDPSSTSRRHRKRSSAAVNGVEATSTPEASPAVEISEATAPINLKPITLKKPAEPAAKDLAEGVDLLKGEEFIDELEDEEDLDDLEDDLEDEDEDGDEDLSDEEEEAQLLASIKLHSTTQIQVLPLSESDLPKTLYLVIDRAAELITQPLREFGDLGQIPVEEVQEKTLPIFDNHRVARRFSKKTQRVVKVPDGKVLHKVSSYLQAKGITRLLIDGQVFSL